jgi:hypothetical protein
MGLESLNKNGAGNEGRGSHDFILLFVSESCKLKLTCNLEK